MPEASARKIALPWYRRESYDAVRAIMEDRHNLAPSYEQWLMAAQNNELVAHQAGLEVEKVMIEPDAFAQWCAAKGLALNSAARTRYAAESARPAGQDA